MPSVAIAEISIGKRFRKDYGGIEELAESIASIGLLSPIVIDSANRLLCGGRRLKALKHLGRTEAEVVVVPADDPATKLIIERDENCQRQQMTPSELVALGMAIEKAEAKAGKARQEAGKEPDPAETGRSRDKAAAAIGMKPRTYDKARRVVEAAQADPKKQALVDEMDRTGKVNGAFRKLQPQRRRGVAGQDSINWKELEQSIGYTVRLIDKVATAAKILNTPTHKGMLRLADELLKSVEEFKKSQA